MTRDQIANSILAVLFVAVLVLVVSTLEENKQVTKVKEVECHRVK